MSTHDESHESHEGVHVVPWQTLVGVFLALMVGTVLTVYATNFHFGSFDIWIAMGIATVKSTLVVLYFMHLRWDRPMNGIIFLAALVFAFLFIGLTLLDSGETQPEIEALRLIKDAQK